MNLSDDLARLPAITDEIAAAIARVATNGTIVCSCCNASDVTDDDHRSDCPVWALRYAIRREFARVEAEVERLRAGLRQAREYCARPAGYCFDPKLSEAERGARA